MTKTKTKTKTKAKAKPKAKKKAKKAKKQKKTPPPSQGKCHYCGETKPIRDVEDDDGWAGESENMVRSVCGDCSPGVNARYACAGLIFVKLQDQLKEKGLSTHQIKHALQLAWKSFHIDLDTKSMVAMGRKLKIKHPWLKGKRAK